MLVPYILGRPFWHPNASFPLATYDGAAQVESLTQKLDIAGKKINEYAQLSQKYPQFLTVRNLLMNFQ